ncbi:MAG: VWA domain-containing protein, partial [Fimbriimonadia bacterium]|nr:VWA domain-containing protein [Fimbriimonadia bacterium]
MRFSDPIYLILAPLIIGFIWWSGRHMLGVDRARRRFSMLLRSFVILLLTLALAGWQMNRPNTGVATLFLLDHSESVPEPDQQSAADFVSLALKEIGSQDKAGVVVFGRDALVDISPIHIKDLPPIYSSPDRQGTDLAGAIRLASALFPDGYSRRIVLLSDGNETQSDARSAAQVAAVDHIEIDTVPLRPLEQKKEVLVARLETPGEAKTGEPFEVKTIIESQANTEGTLIIDRDGVPVKRMPISLSPG